MIKFWCFLLLRDSYGKFQHVSHTLWNFPLFSPVSCRNSAILNLRRQLEFPIYDSTLSSTGEGGGFKRLYYIACSFFSACPHVDAETFLKNIFNEISNRVYNYNNITKVFIFFIFVTLHNFRSMKFRVTEQARDTTNHDFKYLTTRDKSL